MLPGKGLRSRRLALIGPPLAISAPLSSFGYPFGCSNDERSSQKETGVRSPRGVRSGSRCLLVRSFDRRRLDLYPVPVPLSLSLSEKDSLRSHDRPTSFKSFSLSLSLSASLTGIDSCAGNRTARSPFPREIGKLGHKDNSEGFGLESTGHVATIRFFLSSPTVSLILFHPSKMIHF